MNKKQNWYVFCRIYSGYRYLPMESQNILTLWKTCFRQIKLQFGIPEKAISKKEEICNAYHEEYTIIPTPDCPHLGIGTTWGREYHCPWWPLNLLRLALVHGMLPCTLGSCYPSSFRITLEMVLKASSSTITSKEPTAGRYL